MIHDTRSSNVMDFPCPFFCLRKSLLSYVYVHVCTVCTYVIFDCGEWTPPLSQVMIRR